MIGFYVTVVRSPKQVGWLLGPFSDKETAEEHVKRASIMARQIDPWCDFDAFGVARREGEKLPEGRLNARLLA